MNRIVKITKELTEAEKQLRTEVFVVEQGFQEEFDTIDEIAEHIVIFDATVPIACCRYFPAKDNEKETYYLGRVAVKKSYRKEHLGAVVVQQAEQKIRKKAMKTILKLVIILFLESQIH